MLHVMCCSWFAHVLETVYGAVRWLWKSRIAPFNAFFNFIIIIIIVVVVVIVIVIAAAVVLAVITIIIIIVIIIIIMIV